VAAFVLNRTTGSLEPMPKAPPPVKATTLSVKP
jgi:hypothetical protein